MATMTVLDSLGASQTVEKPLAPGRAAAAASRPVALSSEDFAVIDGLETLITATNALLTTQATYLDGVETLLAAATPAGENTIGGTHGWGFDVPVTAATTTFATPYTAGDIMGALLDFSNCARIADEAVIVTGVQVVSKVAVVPALTLILFNADPTSTTKTDNAAYSLNAADAFKAIKSIPISTLYDHGTPNSWSIDGLGIVAKPVSGARNLYGLLIDGTGVTLSSSSDIQVRLRGVGI